MTTWYTVRPRHIPWILDTTLNKGKVTVATDGSVAEKKGYFAVVFHTEDKEIPFQGSCDCVPQLISSYQTELMGILLMLYLLQALSSFTNN
eukprot:3174944-Ditylum_brightwellii.AAC.1